MKKYDVATLQAFAAAKSGLLLSTEYVDNKHKLLWQCKDGHQWLAEWHSILTGKTWCPECWAELRKCSIIELQQFASSKQGKLISTKYINSTAKMLWECEKGHQWRTKWNSIKNSKSWCPACSSALCDIKELQKHAENKNGKLLSTDYINSRQKLLWECSEGHKWKASWDNIKNKASWCPECARCSKLDISKLQQFANNKNGTLLSTNYVNNNTKLLWECSEGHKWKASWDNIKNKASWCPECSSFKTEYKCKELLEQRLNIKFNKTRFYYNKPKFFEFDGYNEEYKIAFEYHGYQHYIFPNFFHKTLEIHEKAVQRDMDKVIYANENNIKLIIIPYTENNNLEEYINKQIENITI
jgi:thiol-disulfide isomerase/thioredoxin